MPNNTSQWHVPTVTRFCLWALPVLFAFCPVPFPFPYPSLLHLRLAAWNLRANAIRLIDVSASTPQWDHGICPDFMPSAALFYSQTHIPSTSVTPCSCATDGFSLASSVLMPLRDFADEGVWSLLPSCIMQSPRKVITDTKVADSSF